MFVTMCHRLLLSLSLLSYTLALNTIVYGTPNASVLSLLIAKLAAKEGIDTAVITADGTQDGCRRLMYGVDYADGGKDEPGNVKLAMSGEDIQDALTKANSIVVACHEDPVEANSIRTLIGAAGEDLSKIVMLSKMGVTKAKGGFLGGGDSKLLESENAIRELCNSNDLALSIIRAGILKGGGPGGEGNDFGLNKCYYNTILDVVQASVTMAHDKYSLGADCTKGDSVEVPNMFATMGTKSSFDPLPYDSNRMVVSAAVVAAMTHDSPVEFSVGTASASEPPTMDEWKTMLEKM